MLVQASFGYLQTTWLLSDIKQTEERKLSKRRFMNCWLQYTHEMLNCCIHWVVVISEHWNCVQTIHIWQIWSHTVELTLSLSFHLKLKLCRSVDCVGNTDWQACLRLFFMTNAIHTVQIVCWILCNVTW